MLIKNIMVADPLRTPWMIMMNAETFTELLRRFSFLINSKVSMKNDDAQRKHFRTPWKIMILTEIIKESYGSF